MGLQDRSEGQTLTTYHDLDEIKSSPQAQWVRPWYVRHRNKPTVEVDWEGMERFDATKVQQVSFRRYIGEEQFKKLNRERTEKFKQWILDDKPGYTLRDRALDISFGQSGSVPVTFLGTWAETLPEIKKEGQIYTNDVTKSKLRDQARPMPLSPDELGVPKYEGSPEENALMIRSALRHFGADQVGFVELNERHRKFIYKVDALDGKRIVFENVETGYETDQKRVIPEKAQWVIVFSIQMSEELLKRRSAFAPTALTSATSGAAYGRSRNIMDRLQTFLHVLGYQGLMGTWFNGLGIAPALGVMAGLGELSRLNRLISPEYGPLQRLYKMVTDLPLAPTQPIDAGIMDFCRTCKTCAEKCPVGTLSKATEPFWEPVGPWNNPGHKTWYEDSLSCRTWWSISTAGCSTCFSVCPFSKKDKSVIHNIVKATIAKNPIMRDWVNSFMVTMDELFGYQKPKDIESWWHLNMPPHGFKNATWTDLE